MVERSAPPQVIQRGYSELLVLNQLRRSRGVTNTEH